MIYNKAKKSFLNDRPDEHSTVSWSVEVDDWNTEYREGRSEDKIVARNAELRLSDCNKHIHIDFFYNTEERFNERLLKLDTLVTELLFFREALIDSHDQDIPFKEKPSDDTVEVKETA